MDPGLIELTEAGPSDEEVSLILRLQDGAEPPPTVRVVCRFGPIITVRCRRADIRPTWESDRVISVKAPRAVHLPRPVGERRARADLEEAEAAELELDPEEAEELADEPARRQRQPLPALPVDGSGVVVGICDWGFDFTHPSFRNEDGSTRLLALWDQRGTGDPRAPAPYNQGRLFTPEAINAALAQPDPCAALGYHPSSGDPGNTGAHGTHVADIVAGSRRYPGSEVGLASGADLVFVHLGAQRLGELDNLGDSVGLLEGLDFVRRTAAAAGRPCVMHLSAGKTGGQKSGATLIERAVDVLLLESPGIALVQSVGNYADTAMHTHARIGPDQTHTIDWLIPPGDRTPNELEIWYSGQDVFGVTLVAPDGQEFSAPLGQRARLGDGGGGAWGNFYHRLHEPNSGQNHIDIFLYTAAPTGRWRVVVHGQNVVDGRLHAWIERDAGSRHQSRFSRAQATSNYTTNTICNSFRAIAVGAHDATHPERPPARFSSRGPTADGRQKPELSAPGVRVLAARSMPRDGWNGERKLVVKSGTSMAAPWVSGTVALMFQAAGRPLTIHEVRRILIGTADPHAGPHGRSSSRLGFGYLNTAAAVEAASRLGSGAAAVPLPEPDEAQPDAAQPIGSKRNEIVDPWPNLNLRARPGPGYTPPGVINPWPDPPLQWHQAYRPGAARSAADYKATLGPIKAASEIEGQDRKGRPRKGTPIGPATLTAGDMLQIYQAAKVAAMLGPKDADGHRPKEAQIAAYVDHINDAFRIMRIDTVEAQALFIAHAVGETGLSKLTEGQINSFEDDPAKVRVDTSLMTDKKDPEGKKGQVLGPRRYSRSRHAESGTVDPLRLIPDQGPMDENQFDQTFIGRGAIQVTHVHNYQHVLMVLERRADDLQKEIDANTTAPDAKQKARDVAKLREVVAAVAADPSQAARPEYTFLFTMGHMHSSPMVKVAAVLDKDEDFGGKSRASAGMTGGHTDHRGQFKHDAYVKAHKILMDKPKSPAALPLEHDEAQQDEAQPIESTWIEEPLGEAAAACGCGHKHAEGNPEEGAPGANALAPRARSSPGPLPVTGSQRGIVTRNHGGRVLPQPEPAEDTPPATPPSLKELNGWSMDSILARLNELAEAPLLALIDEAKTVQGLNAPRLQLALDVVWTKKFSRATLPEFEAILPSRMEVVIPVLENADQQRAIKKFMIRTRRGSNPAGPAPAVTSFGKHAWTLSKDQYRIIKKDKVNKVAEVKEAPDTYVRVILRLAGLDPDAWLSSFTSIKFLGRSVADIHTDLATHLKTVEAKLAEQYGGASKDPVEAGKTLGLDQDIGGGRHAPTSAALSMHLFGMAIDVNYTANPFISISANPVFERAGQLVNSTKASYKGGMSYDQLFDLDAVLEKYFGYLDDKSALEARLAGAKVAPWTGKSADDAQKLIQADLKLVAGQWDRRGSENVLKKSGFLNLKKELVVGMDLSWGGSYGDMMHFDMRNKGNGAKIQKAIRQYEAKKTQEGKETWAKEQGDEQ